MHLHANSLSNDPPQQKLDLASRRLQRLLEQSDDQERDKPIVDAMLSEADLWNHNPRPGASLRQFCQAMIEENPLLYGAVDYVQAEPQSWDLVESVEEVMHHLIPGEGDRQL
jgi:hypothetical protein